MSVEIQQILEERDFSLAVDYPRDTGNNLSRAELEDICMYVIGQTVPNNTVSFRVKTADNKYFLIEYIKIWDKFLYEKMTAR